MVDCIIAAAFRTHDSTLQIKRRTAHYITILRKIQILTFEQSVSRVVNPFLIPYLPILQMPRVEKCDSCKHPYVQSDE